MSPKSKTEWEAVDLINEMKRYAEQYPNADCSDPRLRDLHNKALIWLVRVELESIENKRELAENAAGIDGMMIPSSINSWPAAAAVAAKHSPVGLLSLALMFATWVFGKLYGVIQG